MMKRTNYRPEFFTFIILGSVIGFIAGLVLSAFFPEGSPKLIAGIVGLTTPIIAMFAYYLKQWSIYVERLRLDYEEKKNRLRHNPSNAKAIEEMLLAEKAYYSCLNPEVIQSIYAERLRLDYEEKKNRLRHNPSNTEAREDMLLAGRAYYSYLRPKGAATIYDEQAINNDMTAILGK
jgi:uncharacterized membrane protein YeaQ/YmgE (transglycosylase-associated protein family)